MGAGSAEGQSWGCWSPSPPRAGDSSASQAAPTCCAAGVLGAGSCAPAAAAQRWERNAGSRAEQLQRADWGSAIPSPAAVLLAEAQRVQLLDGPAPSAELLALTPPQKHSHSAEIKVGKTTGKRITELQR